MRTKHLINTHYTIINPEMKINQVESLLERAPYLVILTQKRFLGIITHNDLAARSKILAIDIMRDKPAVAPHDCIDRVIELMQGLNTTVLPVMHHRRFIGTIEYSTIVTYLKRRTVNLHQALHREEQRACAITEKMSEGLVVVDSRGTIIDWNAGQERITGLAKAEAMGQTAWDIQYRFLPPCKQTAAYYRQLRQQHLDIMSHNDKSMWPKRHTVTLYPSRGAEKVLETSYFPIGQDPQMFASISHDITAQHQVREQLSERYHNLELIAQKSNNGIIILDRSGRVLFANQMALCLFSSDATPEMCGNLNIFDHEQFLQDNPTLKQNFIRRQRGERCRSCYDIEIKRPDGTVIFARFSVTSTQWDRRPAHLYTIADITEFKRNEALLKETIASYKKMIENSNVGVIITDAEGSILFVNSVMKRITRYNKKELRSMHFCDLIAWDHQSASVCRLAKGAHMSYPKQETCLYAQGGESRHVTLSAHSIQWGQMDACIYYVDDITPQKDLENQQRRMISELKAQYESLQGQQAALIQQAKMVSLGRLAASISHEISQPLTGIQSHVEKMIYDLSDGRAIDNDRVVNCANEVIGYLSRIKHILNHVRSFSKSDNGDFINSFDVNECINNALMLVNTKYKNSQIRIKLQAGASLPPVTGNIYRFEEVIINLLENAKDALDDKRQRRRFTPKITLSTFMRNNDVCILVHDNGIGVCKANMSKIFDPFFSQKRCRQGTGIGLSISQSIIHDMNGTIDVCSRRGKETTFTICLPIKPHSKC